MHTLVKRTLRLYKNAYTGHPKEVWHLALLTLVNRMGTMVLPFLTVYLTTVLHFSLKEAGALMAAFGLGSLFGTFAGGKIADRFSPKTVIFYSLLISGGFFITLQFVTSFNLLFLLIFCTSLFGEAYRPAMGAAIGNYVSKGQTGRSMAFIRLAINIGMSLAPTIGGFLAVTVGYKYLFWFDGLTCISAAIFFFFVSKSWKEKEEDPSEPHLKQAPVKSLPPYRDPSYVVYLLGSFLIAFCFLQWFHTVPVFIKTEWGFDERYIGILMAVSSSMVALFEMPLVDLLEKRQRVRFALLAGIIFIAFSFLFFLLEKNILWAFVGIIILTIGEILYLPFNNALALNKSPDSRRGEYMAWYYMMWSLGNITGPFLGLTIADTLGFETLWVILFVLCWLSFFVSRLERSL